MRINGFQKMTLLDFPGKVACTLFTGGCNFRCPFCHNALLVTELESAEQEDEQEILSYLQKREGLLDGVCITGGEPLLNKDIDELLYKIKQMGYPVKLDTNGSFPDKLRELVENKLVDYVAMDIKNCKSKYAETIGLKTFDISPVETSVRFLLSGKTDFEFRTTIVSEFHTEDDILQIAQWIQGAPRYYLQNFEDSGNLIGENLHAVPKDTLIRMRDTAARYIPCTEIRGI